jgi:hypothetical protein
MFGLTPLGALHTTISLITVVAGLRLKAGGPTGT